MNIGNTVLTFECKKVNNEGGVEEEQLIEGS